MVSIPECLGSQKEDKKEMLHFQHVTHSRAKGSGQHRNQKSESRTLSTTSDSVILFSNETKYVHIMKGTCGYSKAYEHKPLCKKGSVSSYRGNHKTSQASQIHLNNLFSLVLWPLFHGPLTQEQQLSREQFLHESKYWDICLPKGIFIISGSCWSWCPISVCQKDEQHAACKQSSHSLLQGPWDQAATMRKVIAQASLNFQPGLQCV